MLVHALSDEATLDEVGFFALRIVDMGFVWSGVGIGRRLVMDVRLACSDWTVGYCA